MNKWEFTFWIWFAIICGFVSGSVSTAHAGWWSQFVERHLIADDPYQFESAPLEWLARTRDFYEIRQSWGSLTDRELSYLDIIKNELARRECDERLQSK